METSASYEARSAPSSYSTAEPACGAALALEYQNVAALPVTEDLLLVACGGAGVNYRDLVELRETIV